VASGVTQIFDPEGRPPGEFTPDPLDAVFLDDRRVFHGVTPIAPLDSQSAAAALLGKWSVTNCESHVTGFLPQSAGTTLHRLRDFIDRSFGFGVLTQLFFVCPCP
jgi:2-oxoglutarate-Fe(II)-dependent dioxygenase family protein